MLHKNTSHCLILTQDGLVPNTTVDINTHTEWFSIAFDNFEDMLYGHKEVKMQIHVGLGTSVFWDTATSSLYVARTEIFPVGNFLIGMVGLRVCVVVF
jgi:hypothetical protein